MRIKQQQEHNDHKQNSNETVLERVDQLGLLLAAEFADVVERLQQRLGGHLIHLADPMTEHKHSNNEHNNERQQHGEMQTEIERERVRWLLDEQLHSEFESLVGQQRALPQRSAVLLMC